MPPQLRLIENENTGEQALWSPETQDRFDVKDYRVIEHEKTGQQALYDSANQSIVAYLPRRIGQKPTGEIPSDYQAITKEYPVEYGGPVGIRSRVKDFFGSIVKPPTNALPTEDIFRTGIEGATQPPTPTKEPTSKTMLTDIRPEAKPTVFQRLAMGPLGEGIEKTLNLARQVGGAPEGATLEGLVEAYKHSREQLDEPLREIFGQAGEAISHPIASARAAIGGGFSMFFPRFVNEGLSPLMETIGKGYGEIVRLPGYIKPEWARGLEPFAKVTESLAPDAVMILGFKAAENVLGKTPTSASELKRAARNPKFVQELTEADNIKYAQDAVEKLRTRLPEAPETTPIPKLAVEAQPVPETLPRAKPESVGPRIEGAPAFISKVRRQELMDLGYGSEEIAKMTPAQAETLVQAQRVAPREVPRAETQPPEVPAVEAAKTSESYQEPARLMASEVVKKIESQQSPEHFDRAKITKEVEKGGETYVKTEVDPNALNVPRETTVEPGVSAPEKGPIVVDDKGKVIDGRHRVVDAKAAGEGTVEAYVPEKFLSKEQLRGLEFSVPEGGSSITPKTAFEFREAKLKDPSAEWESLADIAAQKDEFRINEILGKGWERDFGPANLRLKETIRKGEPVTIYRATDLGEEILPGAYVSESAQYARTHGETRIPGGKFKILKLKVYPDELLAYGDPHEFLYIPRDLDTAYGRLKSHPPPEQAAVELNVAAQKIIGSTERRTQLEQAIANGEMRLRSRKNAIGERLSGKEIAATRKAVVQAKAELASPRVKTISLPKLKISSENQSLAGFLKNEGGISIQKSGFDAGELRPRRESSKGKQFINAKTGRSVNDAAERAYESGFIEEPTTEALYKAIDSEIEGKPIYSVKGEAVDRKFEIQAGKIMARGEEVQMEADAKAAQADLVSSRVPLEYQGQIYEKASVEKGGIRLTDDIDQVLTKPDEILSVEKRPDLTKEAPFDIPSETPDIALTKEAGSKQPWEMTEVELRATPPAYGKGPDWNRYHRGIVAGTPHQQVHKSLVETALSEGKPVPRNVLAEYPDLVKPRVEPTEAPQLSLADAKRIAKQFPLIKGVTERAGEFEPQFDASTAMNRASEVISQREAFKKALAGEKPTLQLEGEQARPIKAKLVQQGLLGKEAPQAKAPEGALKSKAPQAEGPSPLEKAAEGSDLSQMSLADLVKKGFGEETGAVGQLTPEQQTIEADARAARKELYRRLSEEARKTGENLDKVAERMKVPPQLVQRLRGEQEVAEPGVTPAAEMPDIALTKRVVPETEFVTSIKNAAVDEELAKMGLPPATHGEHMSFEEARAAAAKKIEDDPFAGQKLVNELVGKERPVTATEDAILLHEQTRLKNERVLAEDQLIEAQKSGDKNAISQAKARVESVTADFMTIGDVVTKAGTESSLSLGHRRMMMKEDYSLAAMERSTQISKGRPLTEGERAEVKTLHEKINATEKALSDYMAGSKAREAEAEMAAAHYRMLLEAKQEPIVKIDPRITMFAERIVKSLENEADAARVRLKAKLNVLAAGVDPTIISDAAIIGAAKIARAGLEFGKWSAEMMNDLGGKIQPYLKAIWDASNKLIDKRTEKLPGVIREKVVRAIKKTDVVEQRAIAKERIRTKVEAGQEADIGPLAQKLARLFVEQGIKERNALIDAVHGELKDILPNITRRDVMDAISGYGKYKQLSKDEISVQLRDLKGQMQQVAKLEDIQSREPPLKTGVERRTPSDEERRLIQQVNEAKRRFGIVTTDPTTQLRSVLDARKSYYRHQIADLEAQIKNKERFVKEKTPSPTDPELERLKVRRDELKNEFDEIFQKPGLSDTQRVSLATRGLERSIADLEQRIKTGEIAPRPQVSKTPSTPELEAMRVRRDALREQLQELRDAANPKKTPDEIALQSLKTRLKNHTADLLDRMARGDFSPKPRREVKLDPEAIRLQVEDTRAREQFQERQRANELANRKPWQKGLDTFVRWERAFKLSSPVVFGKLTAAALTRLAATAMEETVGGVLSKIPGISRVASQAPREGGLNIRAMAKGVTEGITKGMSDALQTARTGASDLDVLYGQKLLDRDWANFFGQLHGMMKAPIKRAEFTLSLEKRIAYAIRNGVDVTDPLVQVRLSTEALDDGYRSIFMQHGFSSDMFNNFVRTLETSKKYPIAGEISARTLRFLLPIVRVPANIVAETATGIHGTLTASSRVMFHAINGTLDNLPPAIADSIMRQFKKGSIGLGLMAIGYFNPEFVGGYDWREKRRPGTVKVGGFQILGMDVPRWMTHAPWFELMQIGGTIRHVKDQHVAKTREEKGIEEGLWAAALGLLEETPFIGEMVRVDRLFGRPDERRAFLGEMARSTLVPQAVQWAAKQTDKDTMSGEVIRRKPKSFLEEIKMGIPGLREEVRRETVGEARRAGR